MRLVAATTTIAHTCRAAARNGPPASRSLQRMKSTEIPSRLRAVLDLMIPAAREESGRHEYDGVVQDLSSAGVAQGLASIAQEGPGDGSTSAPALEDAHDEAHLVAHERALRWWFGQFEAHRRNPLVHLGNLDLSCYEREYAPEPERRRAIANHVARWPDAIDAAIRTLDRVPAPVARALVSATRGLAAGIPDAVEGAKEARAAHERLVLHLEHCAVTGAPEVSIGATDLAALMGEVDAAPVDLTDLAERADQEERRLRSLLDEACQRLRPGVAVPEVVAELMADHLDGAGVIAEASKLTAEVIEFTREHGLVTYLDGECQVGLATESRRWGIAMLAWAAPGEPDSPSRYDITPPEDSWPLAEQEEWLSTFNTSSMLAITVHEVSPGHFAHGRALRRASSPVRRTLIGAAFAEGWAHYAEEMMLEEGFRSDSARYAAGVALEALCRVTRLACAIGLHTGAMDVAEAARRFESHAFLSPATSRSEAQRGTFDPGYGMYTWGKWEILRVRDEARRSWGSGYSTRRFHDALLALGSPPLGLLGTAVLRG